MQYRELEEVLAQLIGVHFYKRPRFQARLKALQRMGFPDGVNAGKSARADYRAEQVFKLAFVLELLQIGISPERAIKFVRSWWDKIRRALILAGSSERTISIVFWPKDFGGLTSKTDDEEIAWSSSGSALISVAPDDVGDLKATAIELAMQPRSVILNVSRIWHEIVGSQHLSGEAVQELKADVAAWGSEQDIIGRPLSDGNP